MVRTLNQSECSVKRRMSMWAKSRAAIWPLSCGDEHNQPQTAQNHHRPAQSPPCWAVITKLSKREYVMFKLTKNRGNSPTIAKSIFRAVNFLILTLVSFWLFACQAQAFSAGADPHAAPSIWSSTLLGMALLGFAASTHMARRRHLGQRARSWGL